MASLKEIKGRITSVKSTRKITAAMKMVASAKLRKMQYQAERFHPYATRLADTVSRLLPAVAEKPGSPLLETREVKRVTLAVFSSDSGLCGAFNANILRTLAETLEEHRALNREITLYPAGKKAEEALRKSPLTLDIRKSPATPPDKPALEAAAELADLLVADFLARKTDRVELIYSHLKSTAIQTPVRETLLPLTLPTASPRTHSPAGYLVEPDPQTLLNTLLPKYLRSKIYALLLDSAAAEQAARTVAMQIATDNVDEILDDLLVRYNKQRQQAISSELLDILGGSQ
jgi:F-type H+-transporting ATPase subunit gamma